MAKLSILQFIRDQYKTVPPVVTVDLSGKTVLVVGANTGLGLEAAKHFASMNPGKLLLACRNAEKGKRAIEAIEAATGFTRSELRIVDLSKFSSVVEFANKCDNDRERLDVYVYNAGVYFADYEATEDGWETTLQVNHLSCMLLSILLVPCLFRAVGAPLSPSPYPRMVIVASDAHFWATLSEEELGSNNMILKLNDKEYCDSSVMGSRYVVSKMLNVFFSRELAARLPSDSPIIVNSVDPGYCISELRRSFSAPRMAFDKLMELALARTTEQGGRQLVWAAVGGQGRENELRGAYVSSADIKDPSDVVLDKTGEVTQKRIFDESVAILSKVSPRFQAILEEHRLK